MAQLFANQVNAINLGKMHLQGRPETALSVAVQLRERVRIQ